MPASRRDTTILLEENYETLRRRAHRLIDRERRFLTLPPTDYLHQAYLRTRKRGVRLSELSPIGFIRYLTREMRWVRADHVRHRLGSKRGGGSAHVSIEELSLTALGGLTSV
ncbi:MAG: hypothetical protein KC729_02530, partial [Candidatus Eisenbacteria bacterium]|nr:hypothetical protein [Candidatus Eisenbacteria bacterium]